MVRNHTNEGSNPTFNFGKRWWFPNLKPKYQTLLFFSVTFAFPHGVTDLSDQSSPRKPQPWSAPSAVVLLRLPDRLCLSLTKCESSWKLRMVFSIGNLKVKWGMNGILSILWYPYKSRDRWDSGNIRAETPPSIPAPPAVPSLRIFRPRNRDPVAAAPR